jgi:hypothetical protein
MVTNPTIGTFGQREDDPDARRVVAVATRSGSLFVYRTGAEACADASWPRFHHDNANSGDYRRDAVSPGRPGRARVDGRTLKLTAPGDDGLCGRAAGYQVAQSNTAVTGGLSLGRLRGAAVKPADPGDAQSIPLAGPERKVVAVRAVDEQGNVGPLVTIGKGTRPAKLRVTVSPRNAVHDRRTTFRIRVRDARGRAVRGAVVKFAGRRFKTDRRGRVVARVKVGGKRRYSVSARRGGARGRAVVRVIDTRA